MAGLHLIGRDPAKPVLRRATWGLISYGLAAAALNSCERRAHVADDGGRGADR